METIIISVDNNLDNKKSYQQAVDILKMAVLSPFRRKRCMALARLRQMNKLCRKFLKRKEDRPIIRLSYILVHKEEVANYATDITADAEKLMDAFWPGPLTLVFDKIPGVIAANVTPGVETVGIRMPDHPVALRLLRELGETACCAECQSKRQTEPDRSSTCLKKILNGLIPLILDGGQTGVGVESTVIDMTTYPPTILRPGGVTQEMIEAVIGPVQC